MYDLAAHEGQPQSDHATCDTARRLEANVETYRAWVQMLKEEAEATRG